MHARTMSRSVSSSRVAATTTRTTLTLPMLIRTIQLLIVVYIGMVSKMTFTTLHATSSSSSLHSNNQQQQQQQPSSNSAALRKRTRRRRTTVVMEEYYKQALAYADGKVALDGLQEGQQEEGQSGISIIDLDSLPSDDKPPLVNFTFPTVQERVQYYMGHWYNNDDRIINASVCQKIPRFVPSMPNVDKPMIFTGQDLVEAAKPGAYSGQFHLYARDAHDNYFIASDNNNDAVTTNQTTTVLIFAFGDRFKLDRKHPFPAIAKSRHARGLDVTYKEDPIIGLLDVQRNYQKVMDTWRKKRKLGLVNGHPTKDILYWRGSSNDYRLSFVERFATANRSDIDVAFSKLIRVPAKDKEHFAKLTRPALSLEEELDFKYLLNLEGMGVSVSLKWMLTTDSVVFMPRPTVASWAMEDLLVPFYHYVPLEEGASHVLAMLQWARRNPQLMSKIAKQSTQFMEDLYISKQAKQDNAAINQAIVQRYNALYGDVLRQCVTDMQ